MNKIQRVSRYFEMFFKICFFILAISFIVSWIAVAIDYTELHDLWVRFVFAVLQIVSRLFILYFLIKLFSSYANNEIFTIKNSILIRNIGYTLLAKQLFTSMWNFITENWIGISVSSIEMIILALLIIVNAWIMKEACTIKEEHQLTV